MPPRMSSTDPERQPAPTSTPAPWGSTEVVGKALPRIDAYERVSGSAVYSLDLLLPGMLHAAVLRCPHAHAVVKKIDARAAERMPGVRAVLTPSDPEAAIVVPYPWWISAGPPMLLFDRTCRYAGEEVAAVAADTPHQAWDAVRAIAAEYEERPFVLDAEEALKPGAPAVHASGNQMRPTDVYERGDVAKGFSEADVVVEQTFRTCCQIHTPMETHGSVARWDGARLTVWDTTQGVFDQQKYLASALGLPLSSVRVIGPYMGGGFGGKAELGKYTVIAALLAKRTGRPVKLFLTREETLLCVGNRPANVITVKAGVRRDGRLVAIEMKSLGAVGAYADMADAGMDLYLCPNARLEATEAYINAGKARAMRAPGFPQAAWALEQVMDALAEEIGMDPVDLRIKNIATFSQTSRASYTSVGLRQCLEDGARAFGWQEGRRSKPRSGHLLRGVGMAAGYWPNGGRPPATATVRLLADGSVNLNLGASDIGTGTKTVMAMIVAEELGVPLSHVEVEHADTATTEYAQLSGGSTTVMNNAPAVREAAAEVKRQVLVMAAQERGLPVEGLVLKDGRVGPAGDPARAMRLADLEGLARQRGIVGVGHRGPNPPGKAVSSFAVHFAEVEVNALTGEVRVVRLLGAHDSGRVMNLLTYRNQVFGGMTMGIGFGMTERRVLDPQTGRMVNANWHDYKIPTAKDVPADLACLPVDPKDTECNTVGAKGIGEPATVPTAAAIANAVYHATEIRLTDTPINPTQLVELLAERRKR